MKTSNFKLQRSEKAQTIKLQKFEICNLEVYMNFEFWFLNFASEGGC